MGSSISLTASDGVAIGAYRAAPRGAPRAGLVVCQEIFGVNSHIRSLCNRFAGAGYLAVAPALFDRIEPDVELGYGPEDIEAGRKLMQRIDFDNALRDVAAAIAAASSAGKVGVIGYCWGGTMAWAAATRLDGVSAAVGYYGGGIGNMVAEQPRCPVMLHFGEKDQSIPLSVAESVGQHHPDVPVYIYDAGHGFNCDQRGSYDVASADLALERTLTFFAGHLA